MRQFDNSTIRQLSHETTISHSPTETSKLAQDLASQIKPGSILALCGDLGSGKTTFTQSLAKALGITQRVTSPTFILMRQYPLPQSSGMFYHLDLYRIGSPEDIKSIDLEELIAEGTNIIVIEWPEKIETILPPHTLKIYFKTTSATTREITLSSL